MPRVLLILADDLGLDLWNHPEARRPNLSRMAAEGRTYPIAWGAASCSPFRAQLLTGLEPHRDGNLVGKNISPQDSYSLPVASGTLLTQLADTFWAGKWHSAQHSDFSHPGWAGCQHFIGSMANLADYFAWWRVWNGTPTVCTEYATVQVAADALVGVQLEYPLVVASFHPPHVPTHNPPAELTTFPPTIDPVIQSLAMIEAMDHCLGRLVHEADRRGYTVLFGSDNGSWLQAKGTLREESLRVPLLAYGAGVAQGTSALPIQATDLRATILELLSAPGDPLDGASFAADLQGGRQQGREYLRCSSWPELGQPPTLATWDRTVRDARWHLLCLDGGAAVELYDLENDPTEAANVAGLYPEEVHRLVQELPQ